MKCPICNRDRDDKIPLQKAKKIMNKIGLEQELCNPGGRQIRLKGYRSTLQLSDQCNWCDYDKIINYIRSGDK